MSNYPKRIYVLPARQPRVASTYQNMAPPPLVMRAPKRAISTDQIVAELLGDDMGPSGPRKRERLNHLTQEEKMDRRKFKNRVAAQNARDKKKERSGKIDEVMRKLVEENNRLRAENEKLRRQNEKFQSRQQQQMQIVNEQSSPVMYQNENIVSDSTIYSNVAYEEEVVGEEEDVIVSGGVMEYGEDQRAFESAEFINAPQQRDKANRFSTSTIISNTNVNTTFQHRRSDSKKVPVNSFLTLISLLSNHMDPKMSASTESLNTFNPSEEFDRFVADYIEEGGDCSSSSAASGSPSQTRETFSPCASLTMSPSMSCNSSNNDWNDDFFLPNESCETSTETIEEDPLLTDPGNWNFENFDEDSIDLNFFNN